MALPTITEQSIKDLLPGITAATPIGQGGQKIVFRAVLDGNPFALKFALLNDDFNEEDADEDETVLRARRETQIMRECTSPHIVKAGPIDLGTALVNGQM